MAKVDLTYDEQVVVIAALNCFARIVEGDKDIERARLAKDTLDSIRRVKGKVLDA